MGKTQLASSRHLPVIESVVQLPLTELVPFPDHPFSVRDDEAMQDTTESIRQSGVLMPLIVRPGTDGCYQIISGHRRKHAAELLGLETVPAIVRHLDDDEAIIFMVDSNVQRENILPSEKAKAYKMKMEAIKRQGARRDLTSAQVGQKLKPPEKWSIEKVAADAQSSRSQVQRFIRLTELSQPLQQMVDEQKIGLTPAVEISYLKPEEQKLLVETIDSEQATPSLSQAQRMRQMSKLGKLNEDTMLKVMSEQKKPEGMNITLPWKKVSKYFPSSYTPRQIEDVIFRLLAQWQRRQQQNQER